MKWKLRENITEGETMDLFQLMKKTSIAYINAIEALKIAIEEGKKETGTPVIEKEKEKIEALNKIAGVFGRFVESIQDSGSTKEIEDKFFKGIDPAKLEEWIVEGDYPWVPMTSAEELTEWRDYLRKVKKDLELGSLIRKTSNLMNSRPLPTETIISKEIVEGLFTPIPAPSEKQAENLIKLQAEGKLLDGTIKGLAGGAPYFKAFVLGLAIILDKQSRIILKEKNNNPGGGIDYSNTGILPILGGYKDLLKIEGTRITNSRGTIEDRQSPYIIVRYRELADILGGEGKVTGGKDIKFIREYIRKLSEKKTIIPYTDENGVRQYVCIPLFTLKREYADEYGNEDICLLELSYQFSRTIRGYSGLRPDTLNRMGGAGKQKDITMSLFTRLVYSRGTGGNFVKDKNSLLQEIGGGKQYVGRPGKLKSDFAEAIRKVTDAKLITEYREMRGKSGKVNCIFVYNPRYFDE